MTTRRRSKNLLNIYNISEYLSDNVKAHLAKLLFLIKSIASIQIAI